MLISKCFLIITLVVASRHILHLPRQSAIPVVYRPSLAPSPALQGVLQRHRLLNGSSLFIKSSDVVAIMVNSVGARVSERDLTTSIGRANVYGRRSRWEGVGADFGREVQALFVGVFFGDLICLCISLCHWLLEIRLMTANIKVYFNNCMKLTALFLHHCPWGYFSGSCKGDTLVQYLSQGDGF